MLHDQRYVVGDSRILEVEQLLHDHAVDVRSGDASDAGLDGTRDRLDSHPELGAVHELVWLRGTYFGDGHGCPPRRQMVATERWKPHCQCARSRSRHPPRVIRVLVGRFTMAAWPSSTKALIRLGRLIANNSWGCCPTWSTAAASS